MPLQNRVSPNGTIESTPARGLMMGNRGGCLHDAETRTLSGRRWVSQRWIACVTQFRGRKRTLMAANRYTELFFLDEVTALAAGHRPCFECRRSDAKAYAAAFPAGPLPADAMDKVLHRERCVSGGPRPEIGRDAVAALPPGSMVAQDDTFYAVGPEGLLRWQFDGYRPPDRTAVDGVLSGGNMRLLTPPSTIAALRRGFAPLFQGSAGA